MEKAIIKLGSANMGRRLNLSGMRDYSLLLVLVVLCIIASVLSPNFTNTANITNILRQISMYGIVAVGMTFVILTKGIDLSVGSIVGLTSVVTALMLAAGFPIPVAIVLALLCGLLFGALNGALIAWINMPPFIVTLGTMVMGRGLALTLAEGSPLSIGDSAAKFSFLGSGYMLGVPVPVWIFAIIVAFSFYVLKFTSFGRDVYAVGSNTEAARLAGINVRRVNCAVYMIAGVLSALTALIYVSRLTVGQPIEGTGLELEAITIVVIGGTSLFGGEGSVIGTVIGAAIIAVLANILNFLGISPFSQQIVKGALILLTVMFETYRRQGNPFKRA